jgi:phosphoglycolate phosphatase
MGKYKFILFDLDGTLSDPKIGITKSVQYALKQFGIIEPDLNELDGFIGPPLQESFAGRYGFDEEKAQKAIEFYRERFTEKGMFENVLYPDIRSLLESLKQHNYTLVVATSKPTVYAVEILKYFQIDHYFDRIVGSNLDGTRIEKTDIIQYILDDYKDHKKEEFIMIGDRKHDIIGAKNVGIDSIGVTYGYGSIEELSHTNPSYLVNRVDEIKDVFLTETFQ